MAQPYLEIRDLKKYYGTKTILDIDSIAIERGEVLAIIGPNGAGKSTFLRVVAHLEKPATGTIKFNLVNGSSGDLDIRRKLAMVFQEPLLFTGKVFYNIAYGLKIRKVSPSEIDRRVENIAGMFGISHLLDLPSHSLSGGEAQRVSLARAFVLEPELLLLDEPMASLDPPTKESLLADLRRILNELDTTVIYVTHERTEATILADRLAVMDQGKIVQIGRPDEVIDHPISRKIADFVGVENILIGNVIETPGETAHIKMNDGMGEIEAVGCKLISDNGGDGEVWVFIRPENIAITPRVVGEKNGVPNHLGGTVKGMVDLGPLYRVFVDCGFPLTAFVTKQSAGEMNLREGQPVWLSFSANKVQVVAREGERV